MATFIDMHLISSVHKAASLSLSTHWMRSRSWPHYSLGTRNTTYHTVDRYIRALESGRGPTLKRTLRRKKGQRPTAGSQLQPAITRGCSRTKPNGEPCKAFTTYVTAGILRARKTDFAHRRWFGTHTTGSCSNSKLSRRT